MIVQEPGAPGEARVIGSLTGDGIQILLDAVDSGVVVLDLSEVDRVDDSAVRVLAGLRPERCKLQNCPRWLELWLARVRGGDAPTTDEGARHAGEKSVRRRREVHRFAA